MLSFTTSLLEGSSLVVKLNVILFLCTPCKKQSLRCHWSRRNLLFKALLAFKTVGVQLECVCGLLDQTKLF